MSKRKKRLSPKSIKMDGPKLLISAMVYLRDCSYVSSMCGESQDSIVINATDGSKWRMKIEAIKKMAKSVKVASNAGKPYVRVRHGELDRIGDSLYKSQCPMCKDGVLAMRRHTETMKLQNFDFCLHCGQAFIYLDIAKVRKRLA